MEQMQQAEKLKVSWALKNIFSKLVSPSHWAKMNAAGARGPVERVDADAQLKLYADLMPDGFVHFGYFEDPDIAPEAISIAAITQAQRNHGELVASHVIDKARPVLDVGCGMGGLARILHQNGHTVVAVTPDRYQCEYLRQNMPPEVAVLQSRFEDLPLAQHEGRYGTIVTSESLQYLDKRVVFPMFEKLLAEGGRWVICDYLRLRPGHAWSFSWPELKASVATSGFTVVEQRDITPHIVPTLKYAHMLGSRIARPAVDFLIEKVRGKEPKVGYLLGDVFDRVQLNLQSNLDKTDPKYFLDEKSYRLWVLEKKRPN